MSAIKTIYTKYLILQLIGLTVIGIILYHWFCCHFAFKPYEAIYTSILFITFIAIVLYTYETRKMQQVMSSQYLHSLNKDEFEKQENDLFWRIYQASHAYGGGDANLFSISELTEPERLLAFELLKHKLIRISGDTGQGFFVPKGYR